MKRSLFSSAALAAGAVAAVALTLAASASADTISQNFESLTLGGTTPPTGWSLVKVGGSPSYVTAAGYTGSGLGGEVKSEEAGALGGNYSADGQLPEGYLVDSGGPAFDATQAINGSFDFYVGNSGNYAADTFMMGNIQTGYLGSSSKDPGQLIGANLRENTFSQRASLVAGDSYTNSGSTTSAADPNLDNGTSITFTDTNSSSTYKLSNSTWYSADFSWTPSSGTTGTFTYTVNNTSGTKLFSLTATGFILDSKDVYFGFGNSSPETTGNGTFDNISITGTAVGTTVPEPASIGLLSLGGLGLLLLGKRRKTA